MKQVDNIDGGLVILIDWQKKTVNKYRGFDGKYTWPNAEWQSEESDTLKSVNRIYIISINKTGFESITMINGLVSADKLNQVLTYRQKLQEENRLLYLKYSGYTSIPKAIQEKFIFLGYDYGNYVSEGNYYSLILHEIIGGARREFKDFAKYLNHNLLFSSLDITPSLEKIKKELLAQGAHLEDEQEGEEFQPIAVYEYKDVT